MSDYLALYFDKREELDAGRNAFAAIVSWLRALEAENAAQTEMLKSLRYKIELGHWGDLEYYLPQIAALLAASEEAKR